MKVEVDASNSNIILVNGQKFIQKKTTIKKIGVTTHADRIIYEPMNEEKFEEDLDYIVNKIASQTNTTEILKDILKHTEPRVLRSIAKKLREGNKPKKQRGCLGFEIGGKYLEITP